MPFALKCIAVLAVALAANLAHAADKNAAEAMAAAESVAWSLDQNHTDMVVAVSPVRQTLQIAGSAGTLLGASISAIANEKYRKAIEETLADYNGFEIFQQRLQSRLNEVLAGRAHPVSQMGSTAGANNARDIRDARLEALANAGHDVVLDLDPDYGLFGYQGLLVAKLEAKLYDTESGRLVWSDTLMATTEYLLATDKLKDPTKQLMPNLSDPRFSIAEDAIAQWTGDNGVEFRKRFEEAVDGCISALLTDLGLAEDAAGAYYLGRVNLMRKQFDTADHYLNLALRLDPGHLPAKNALSIAHAHKGRTEQAIALAKEIHAADSKFAPATYNLAWWLAVEEGDAAGAQPYYDQAKSQGMYIPKKLAKALGE